MNTVPDVVENLSKKEKKDIAVVDEGGPEAQFFSYVFQRLPQLKVSLPDSTKSIKLFETESIPSGYLPTSDGQFKSRFGESDEYRQIVEKAELYHRAIGRLFAHCLSVGHKTAN